MNMLNTKYFSFVLSLQWDFSKASNKWVGLIIKLEFYCAQKPTTQLPVNTRCILIKFKETDVCKYTYFSRIYTSRFKFIYEYEQF